ncbi:DUF7310 family coiled-coil domain-containing protein [Halosegnis marinus]|uniref:DUF7310 domain-containing protein n=1 Tax=Halosegnis marinus TaxID=3034023 RepID=A0ABD5ZRB5_9EURY|nr:hypothetical protein [Halosegnis sp. DT85]
MTLEDRLDAVERTITDDDRGPADLSNAAAVERRLDALAERLDAMEDRLADAEGDVATVRGHVGNAERIDRETAQVAQRALAVARETEARLDEETPRPRERSVPVESEGEPSLGERLRDLW